MIISTITDPQYFAPEQQPSAFDGAASAPSDPGYFVSEQQDFVMGAGSVADPEYVEGVDQNEVEPIGFTEIYFGIPPLAPYIESQDPAPFASGVGRNKIIEFDLLDINSDLLLSSVLIYVEGALAYRGDTDTFIAPYNDGGSARSVVVGPPAGHHFAIDKSVAWDSYSTVTVRVVATDSLLQSLDTTYQFYIEDWAAPTIDTPFPAHTTLDVSETSLISFSTHDPSGSGIDSATINCTVNGTDAIINGVFETGWDGVGSLIAANGTDGYDVTIEKVDPMGSYELHTVIANADDNSGNSAPQLLWWFRTEDYLGPLVAPVDPTNGQSAVPVTNHVIVDVTDEQLVSSNSVKVEVDLGFGFVLAYEQGAFTEFKSGYDGPDSGITTISGGYRVTIDLTTDFPLATEVSIRVTADDPEGNPERL
jgi:hypothetical protein